MRRILSRDELPRIAALVLLGAVIAWGLRLTILEGFVYEWRRAFYGDFYAAMYERVWWDGTGIMYGPVFVAERSCALRIRGASNARRSAAASSLSGGRS
jgi:hypothetical protein